MSNGGVVVGEFYSWKDVVAVLTAIELPCVIIPSSSIHTELVVDSIADLKNAVTSGLDASPIGKIQIKSVPLDV